MNLLRPFPPVSLAALCEPQLMIAFRYWRTRSIIELRDRGYRSRGNRRSDPKSGVGAKSRWRMDLRGRRKQSISGPQKAGEAYRKINGHQLSDGVGILQQPGCLVTPVVRQPFQTGLSSDQAVSAVKRSHGRMPANKVNGRSYCKGGHCRQTCFARIVFGRLIRRRLRVYRPGGLTFLNCAPSSPMRIRRSSYS
jgi:hypothetical protein